LTGPFHDWGFAYVDEFGGTDLSPVDGPVHSGLRRPSRPAATTCRALAGRYDAAKGEIVSRIHSSLASDIDARLILAKTYCIDYWDD
jgi:hypothetical protein